MGLKSSRSCISVSITAASLRMPSPMRSGSGSEYQSRAYWLPEPSA